MYHCGGGLTGLRSIAMCVPYHRQPFIKQFISLYLQHCLCFIHLSWAVICVTEAARGAWQIQRQAGQWSGEPALCAKHGNPLALYKRKKSPRGFHSLPVTASWPDHREHKTHTHNHTPLPSMGWSQICLKQHFKVKWRHSLIHSWVWLRRLHNYKKMEGSVEDKKKFIFRRKKK